MTACGLGGVDDELKCRVSHLPALRPRKGSLLRLWTRLRDSERDIDVSARRIDEIRRDIEHLVPPTGDSFVMSVTD